jgi:hypothetical protein
MPASTKLRWLLPLVVCTTSCRPADSASDRPPYQTTFTAVNDTIIASTTGDVPQNLLHQLVVEWRATGDSTVQAIGDVSDMAVGADGTVWVWDGATPALWLLDANGTSLRRIGRPGSGPGEYRNANSIAVARDGALVMWDDGNARLTIYNPDGTYRSSPPLTFSDCCGLPVVIDTQNRIWLTSHPRMIGGKEKGIDPAEMSKPGDIGYFRYDSTGSLIDTVIAPTLPGADVLVTALHVSRTGIGGSAQQVPYGTYPRHEVSPLGHIVSTMSRPYAVHTQSEGKQVRVTREFVPPPVSEEERAQRRANIEHRMRRVKADFRWNAPEIPREKPPVSDIAVGLEGRIWVQLSVESEGYEPDPPVETREPSPPPVAFRAREKRWEVFEPDGRYLGRVVAPRQVSVFVRRGNQVWGVVRDETDLPVIVRMRIEPAL